MQIEIKTLQDIQDNRIKLEIIIDPAETDEIYDPVMTENYMRAQAEIERLKAELAQEKAARIANREWAERAEAQGIKMAAELDQAELAEQRERTGTWKTGDRLYTAAEVGDFQASEAELVAGPLRRRVAELEKAATQAREVIDSQSRRLGNLTHRLGEITKIVNHGDVSAQLDPNNATGSWGETLALAIENVRTVLSSSSS